MRTTSRLTPLVLLKVMAVGLSSCGPPDAHDFEAFQVLDSAGIEIVVNSTPAWSGSDSWMIDPEPVLQIGAVEGEDPYLFASVWDAARTPDGRIVVVEGEGYEIRVFGPDGRAISTFGRPGDGPSEFGGPPWISIAPPDTLVVWDPGHYRLSWFSLGGVLIDQVDLRATITELSIMRFVNGSVWLTSPDGSLLWTGPGPFDFSDGLVDHTNRLAWIGDRGASTHDFGSRPAGQTFRANRRGIGNQFAPRSVVALDRDPFMVAIGSSTIWEVNLHSSDGQLRRILRAAIRRTAVTGEMVSAERSRVVARSSRPERAENNFDQLPIPDSLSAIADLNWDLGGNLWVGRRTEDLRRVTTYDVFDQRGLWVASVQRPTTVGWVHEFGDDYILATWKDELDIPYLRMYRLRKPDLGR